MYVKINVHSVGIGLPSSPFSLSLLQHTGHIGSSDFGSSDVSHN